MNWCTPICAASVDALAAPPSPYKILRKGGRKVEVAPTASICRGGPSVNRLLGPRAPSPPSPYRRPPPVWAVESQPPARRWPPLALSHRQPLRHRAPLSSYALARERQSVPTVTLSAGVLSFRSPGGPCTIIITATICFAAALWLREHLHCGPRGCAARTRTDARAPFLFSSLICLARARTLRRPRVLSWARRRAAPSAAPPTHAAPPTPTSTPPSPTGPLFLCIGSLSPRATKPTTFLRQHGALAPY